ncbi:chromosome segregation protein SMC [Clostridium ganghwense]|uniref:Chromosome partition protein Smc n=1 Tax=Clostridium ganghwense TaxID=312089 RepID=A0ABT4CTI6_9CLOT|nr:chromosome segregation protein SMC [Clostridium ganghwense]MCY6372385.1 chromosome segregation protein SMC [Clostridium ganghwense]
MFLKSLEIRGFKSFADKTELVFKRGITAVVGPNGSGKSNISDAVKWVLGEQSVKNLRGGKMQDVIFAGTQYRKPVSLAQVTLILDNSDGQLPIEYTDVTIMRRLFRSGESEYYLNNTKCRLKDIQELFMDTGIGKEGYSIIGQGKIEAVLSGKPEERRSLLEEAAGIVKFKTRKVEAEKKLENTEQNIQRINDIFSTYEERLEPLKNENEKAKQFLELSKLLKSKEVNLTIYNIDIIEKKIISFQNEIDENDVNLRKLLEEKRNIKEKLQQANEELEKFELENNDERKRYYNSKTMIQNLLAEIDLLNERISNLESTIERTSRGVQQFNEKLVGLKNERNTQEVSNKALKNEQNSINTDISNFEKEISKINFNIENNDKLIKNSKAHQVQLISEITKNKNDLVILENDMNTLKNKLEECRGASEAYINSIKINYSTKDMLKNEILNIDNKINQYEEQIKQYKKAIAVENRKQAKDESKLKEFTIEYNKIEANCNALINLEKQYEGYNKSVKNLMQHIDKDRISEAKNKAYILGEIIKVGQKYETAIEVALGGAISNIITDNEKIATKLIGYLKHNKLGRATFLPINIIKGKKIHMTEKLKNIKGYIGIASELIEYEVKYANTIDYVLGRTVIAENMDSALLLAKESGYRFKIVTLEGEVINVGGALTGGSIYHKNTNIISRKREIEGLSSKLKEYDENIRELTDKIDAQKISIKEMDDTCLNLRDEIHYENIEKTKINGKISAIDNDNEKLKRDLNVSKNEIVLIEDTLNNSLSNLTNKQNKIEELILLEKENNIKISSLELEFEIEKENVKNKRENITELKIKKAQIDENVSNRYNDLNRIEGEIQSLEKEIYNLESENKEARQNVDFAKEKITNNEKKIEEINEIINDLDEKFKESEIKRLKIKDSIKSFTENLEKLVLLSDKNERAKNNIQVSLARNEAEKEAVYKKLNEEMELTYAEALEFKIDNINIEEFKKDIAIYKNQISNLGVVNLGAIEEYDELIEKYNFMSAQKEDLIKAKEELKSVVSEMTDKMKAVFRENFVKLRKNFNETFKELFKGGNADLILEDGDELSANIEINVQPPGKKLQNINLMSGGEKGLSAIALLFAILKMKPTPFCILDEIEAALDDSNVARYSEFLKKFSNNTQFIIITHRKGSMEAGDVLYGVTMEEKGVSKIVSVDLSKAN